MEIHVIINSHNKSLNGPMAMPGNMRLIPGHGQIGQKRAIFEIFKPFKSNQLYDYGVRPMAHAQNVSLIFLGWRVTQVVFRDKLHILTQIGPKMWNFRNFQTLQIKLWVWCLPTPKKYP